MPVRYLYRVTFSRTHIFGETEPEQVEIWTAETLAARLTDLRYLIRRAVGEVVEDADAIQDAQRIDEERRSRP